MRQNPSDQTTDPTEQPSESGQSLPAEDIAIGDLMDISPQDRGVALARALLEGTDGQDAPDERAKMALQAAQARQNEAKRNLERARYVARMHEVAVKTLQEVRQQRTYLNQAAADLGQVLGENGTQPPSTTPHDADGEGGTESGEMSAGEE